LRNGLIDSSKLYLVVSMIKEQLNNSSGIKGDINTIMNRLMIENTFPIEPFSSNGEPTKAQI